MGFPQKTLNHAGINIGRVCDATLLLAVLDVAHTRTQGGIPTTGGGSGVGRRHRKCGIPTDGSGGGGRVHETRIVITTINGGGGRRRHHK